MGPRLENATNRRDRIRWGAVWAGFVVALGTYLLIQLALVAVDLVDVANPTTSDAAWTAAAALVAFLLGGVVTGATAMWRGVDTGLLHGIVMWAAALVALITFSAIGSGIALGSIDTSEAFEGVTTGDVEEALQGDAQEAAGQALLGLTAALAAAALGGALGAKMWPRERDDWDDDDRVRMTRSSDVGGRTGAQRQEPVRQTAPR